ncbi:tetratricopeptide repeat protein [Candidatus Hydrogenedentota bacterium]
MILRNCYVALFIVFIQLIASAQEKTEVDKLLKQAQESSFKFNHDEALSYCDKAVALDPNSANAYGCRAIIRSFVRDYEGTIEDCNKAIELDPDNHIHYSFRGRAKHRSKDLDGAIDDYTKSIELAEDEADNWATYSSRGHAKHETGDYEGAIEDFSKSLELDPAGFSDNLNARALAKKMNGQHLGAMVDRALNYALVNQKKTVLAGVIVFFTILLGINLSRRLGSQPPGVQAVDIDVFGLTAKKSAVTKLIFGIICSGCLFAGCSIMFAGLKNSMSGKSPWPELAVGPLVAFVGALLITLATLFRKSVAFNSQTGMFTLSESAIVTFSKTAYDPDGFDAVVMNRIPNSEHLAVHVRSKNDEDLEIGSMEPKVARQCAAELGEILSLDVVEELEELST